MMQWRRYPLALCATLVVCGGVFATAAGDSQSAKAGSDPGMEVLHGAHIMKAKGGPHSSAPSELAYKGGLNGTGVVTGQSGVYLVYWGSQWINNDPSGEATTQQNFFNGVPGSLWNNSVTQYCQGVATGTIYCNGAGTAATNGGVLLGVWYDNSSPAPGRPKQSQIAAEAVKAAQFFGNTSDSQNATVQYVINTATHNNASGFGSQYCAYHSSVSSTVGHVAYTNMPYITDAGANCGAGFNGLGPKAGITIVGGHEFAETETDIYPSAGWLDKNGAENADKCAWIGSGQGAIANVTLTGGWTFPLQALWSNAFNNGAGGCVQSY